VFKTILLIESDSVLKDFFSRVFYIDGFEVIFLENEMEIATLNKNEVESIDMLVVDECQDPETFKKSLTDVLNNFNRDSVPILGVLKKGQNPEAAHNHFDAVMVKDNFNIQLLCDLVERLTS
jgi:hypothetical protein